jgi:hypothetical protein
LFLHINIGGGCFGDGYDGRGGHFDG